MEEEKLQCILVFFRLQICYLVVLAILSYSRHDDNSNGEDLTFACFPEGKEILLTCGMAYNNIQFSGSCTAIQI